MKSSYLQQSALFGQLVDPTPASQLKIVVVIPVLAEKEVITTLKSLSICDRPEGIVEVLIIINDRIDTAEASKKINRETYKRLSEYVSTLSKRWIQFYVFYFPNLPLKKGGVGMARKIGMDEAVRRFEYSNRDGIVLSLDADCIVSQDYFTIVQRFFVDQENLWSAHYPFQHTSQAVAQTERGSAAIEAYELHLRFFINAQRFADFPFAFHTIGSCIAVTSKGYQKMGGMNLRQAGEDFYFLHKFIEAGKHGEIPRGCVYPSGRDSFRVPFGTGKGVRAILNGEPQKSYSMNTFHDLRQMIKSLPELYQGLHKELVEGWFKQLPNTVQKFLIHLHWLNKIKDIYFHTASFTAFRLRFFCWFNALRVIQFAHYCRDNLYPDEPVFETASQLYALYYPDVSFSNITSLLQCYRDWDFEILRTKSSI